MKYLICCLIFLTYSIPVFTADNSIEAESALNKTLLDNGAKSRQYLDAAKKPPTSINILGNKGSSTTESILNLTDQDKQLSENYVDQGQANRILKEKCVGEMEQACAGSEVDHKTMGLSPTMMKVATQAYAMFGAMGGGLAKPTPKPEAGVPAGAAPAGGNGKAAASSEKAEDYCKFIPAATELIATATQKTAVEGLNQGGTTSQKESLLKAAKSHDGRAKQAQIQAVGWYGGSACYATGAAMGKYAMNTSLILKIGAGAFLGTYYQAEVKVNKDYAKKIRDIAASLPNKGDCNPITQNDCYCSEPENENNPTYCKAQIDKRNSPSAFSRTACVDSRIQTDPNCSCEKTNSCFEKFLENQGATELNIGFGSGNSPFKPIASLAHGKLEGGALSPAAFAGTSAIANKALNDFASKSLANNSPLTNDQRSMANTLMANGIPAKVAQLMAQNSTSQGAADKSMAKFSGAGSYQMASNSGSRNSVLEFSGGAGLGVGGKRSDKKSDDILGKFNSKGASTNNGKILEFAQKAEAKASQITKSDKLIFEIISQRYQISGRRLLEIDSNN